MQGQPLDPVQQKRAMEDPEVAKIVQDPAMAQVLKLNTLVYAGIVRLGWSVCLHEGMVVA